MGYRQDVEQRIRRKYGTRFGRLTIHKRGQTILAVHQRKGTTTRLGRKLHYFCHVNGQVRPHRKNCKQTRPYGTKKTRPRRRRTRRKSSSRRRR